MVLSKVVQIYSGPSGPKISYGFVLKKFQKGNFFGTPCRLFPLGHKEKISGIGRVGKPPKKIDRI